MLLCLLKAIFGGYIFCIILYSQTYISIYSSYKNISFIRNIHFPVVFILNSVSHFNNIDLDNIFVWMRKLIIINYWHYIAVSRQVVNFIFVFVNDFKSYILYNTSCLYIFCIQNIYILCEVQRKINI